MSCPVLFFLLFLCNRVPYSFVRSVVTFEILHFMRVPLLRSHFHGGIYMRRTHTLREIVQTQYGLSTQSTSNLCICSHFLDVHCAAAAAAAKLMHFQEREKTSDNNTKDK